MTDPLLIRDLYVEQRIAPRMIARKLGMTLDGVYAILAEMRCLNKRRKKISGTAVRKMAQSGMSELDIARKLDLTITAVRTIRNTVQPDKPAAWWMKREKMPKQIVPEEDIAELFNGHRFEDARVGPALGRAPARPDTGSLTGCAAAMTAAV